MVALGRERHPLSLTLPPCGASATERVAAVSMIVSTRGGGWSSELGALARPPAKVTSADTAADMAAGTTADMAAGLEGAAEAELEMEVLGPFPFGGGVWSPSGIRRGEHAPRVLLLAGGTGICGYLPPLADAARLGSRPHLVWCVRSAADYLALASRLPPNGAADVTVYVTRPTPTPLAWPLTRAVQAPAPDEGPGPLAVPAAARAGQEWLSSAMALVSLASALVGLTAGSVGWSYASEYWGLRRIASDAGWHDGEHLDLKGE